MSMPLWIQTPSLNFLDTIFRYWPQATPSRQQFAAAKIIAHRGVHHQTLIENTLPAFQQAIDAGLAAIEFDVRWTKDLVPVVHHDTNCRRLFHRDIELAKIDFKDLRQMLPQIPNLQEVVRMCAGKVHLFAEMKAEPYRDSVQQMKTLQAIFSPLQPVTDFSLISLSASLLDQMHFLPKAAKLLVATHNTAKFSRLVVDRGYGGLLGHYLFINNKICQRHRQLGQQIGVGFVSSRNSLFRELKRNIFWLSTNHPLALKKIIDEQLA